MNPPGAARLAWSLGTLSVLLVVASRLLEHLNRGWPVQPASGLEWFADAATLLFWSLITAVIDLDSLNTELVAVVSRTMQPALVSLWQRRSGRPEQ